MLSYYVSLLWGKKFSERKNILWTAGDWFNVLQHNESIGSPQGPEFPVEFTEEGLCLLWRNEDNC